MRLQVGMNGEVRVMYSTFGLSDDAKGVGIAGCRRGRLDIVALGGRRGRLLFESFFCLAWARFEAAFRLARSVAEMSVLRVAVEMLWARGFGVLYGAALIWGAFALKLTLSAASVSASFVEERACSQRGVSVMTTSRAWGGEGLLWALGSPLRLRFWATMVILDLCARLSMLKSKFVGVRCERDFSACTTELLSLSTLSIKLQCGKSGPQNTLELHSRVMTSSCGLTVEMRN